MAPVSGLIWSPRLRALLVLQNAPARKEPDFLPHQAPVRPDLRGHLPGTWSERLGLVRINKAGVACGVVVMLLQG